MRHEGHRTTANPGARLHVAAGLAVGAAVALEEAQTHYLRNVLRLAPGDEVALFNGRDGEWRAAIDSLGKRSTALRCLAQTRPQTAEPDLWLLFAPIKRLRVDFLVEKATELGVALLQPVFTRHTAATRLNLERLAAHAVEAAEQTERLSIPVLREPQSLAERLAAWPSDRHLLLCAEAGAARPIADALSALSGTPAGRGPWAVLVGPEGGFAAAELDDLGKLPFVTPVGLGPRILRADTAALAALACWQAILGDGREPTPLRR